MARETSSDDSVLARYLREINRIPLLTREEEEHLARKVAAGDNDAKEALARANLRFVVNVAKRYQNQGLPLLDLISEGNIGLLHAIDRFDVDKGYHFISYAVWWIKQAILKAVCEQSRLIRLPLNRANELVQIDRARKEVQSETGKEGTAEQIGKRLQLKPELVEELTSISRELVSLDAPMYADSESANRSEFVEDPRGEAPDDSTLMRSLREDIATVLRSLTNREADIIKHRFGLEGRRPLSLKEIGLRYHLTKERIRQIEKKALRQLRHPSRAQHLEAYVA